MKRLRAVRSAVATGTLSASLLMFLAGVAEARTFCVVVSGLGGEVDYEQRFALLADSIGKHMKAGVADASVQISKDPASTRDSVQKLLDQISRDARPSDVLILTLIGHGSFDGIDYKLNLPGPDLSARDLSAMLDRIPASRQLVVNTTSASGASLQALNKPGRILVAATRNGTERNATVFARFWEESLQDASCDTNKDESLSAGEAFRCAEQKTKNYFAAEHRILTEHARLEDASKSADRFALISFGKQTADLSSPAKQKLLVRRGEIEAEIDSLKTRKDLSPPDDYKKQLTTLLLDLAKTQREIDQ